MTARDIASKSVCVVVSHPLQVDITFCSCLLSLPGCYYAKYYGRGKREGRGGGVGGCDGRRGNKIRSEEKIKRGKKRLKIT